MARAATTRSLTTGRRGRRTGDERRVNNTGPQVHVKRKDGLHTDTDVCGVEGNMTGAEMPDGAGVYGIRLRKAQ